MLFFGIKNIWFKTIVLATFALVLATFLFFFYRDFYIRDPFDPSLTGTAAYGHNGEDAFQTYALMALVEFSILMAILLPYSFSRFYWIRLVILQPLFFCWLLLMAVAGMHGGGVHALHTLYLLVINAVIFILLIASVIAEVVNNRKNQSLKIFDGTNAT